MAAEFKRLDGATRALLRTHEATNLTAHQAIARVAERPWHSDRLVLLEAIFSTLDPAAA
jgi:hypothetical protein